ncbi:MAG: 16S rRNA (uracil(1498)-N(3))-methyltransferase [Solidesulfovibrio sp.]|uniref:16S rRNA (uracil(1498)-N(3))-methyltransferase n=1 Tax=Solidesulfovibrio sp. TaxID=2910990 RepID=UPI002B2129E1|nr:16S rRNA (uracil(1498)-N(3))-methyltransferase [Solidesulfovibrio sp.]MEA4857005.1 16S rRNA (uracil(1498)-N(3))-methyltransferase [Solidesulfovibrio sp.]
MGRPDAFFIPPESFREPFAITGGEANHCARVLRKKPGAIVRAFDGRGREGLFSITDVGRDRVGLAPVSLGEIPPPQNGIFLAAGFSRSARRDFFLEKAVELGAAGLFFWQAAHSQGRLPEAPKEAWAATLVAAAKQCGAARLPEIAVIPGGAAGLVAAGRQRFPRRFLLWEDEDCPRRLTVADMAGPGHALFVLGPEGGLAEAEAACFHEAGFVPVSLGPRVLRWETAGLAVLALGLAAPAPCDRHPADAASGPSGD